MKAVLASWVAILNIYHTGPQGPQGVSGPRGPKGKSIVYSYVIGIQFDICNYANEKRPSQCIKIV